MQKEIIILILLTGDCHGRFKRIIDFCTKNKLTRKDKIIILGDVGLNYHLDGKDKLKKEQLVKLLPDIICVHGNHEERPQNINSYKEITNNYGHFYVEAKYPNLLFCIDGETYNIEGKSFLCLGGAYSVDKYIRIKSGDKWFKSEQMSEQIKDYVKEKYFSSSVDYIVSHTCPHRYIPTEKFLSGVDQNLVDNSMEYFLDECYENIGFNKWFCGHWHTNKRVDNIRFLYEDIVELR